MRKFVKAGWKVSRQRGSHVMLLKADYVWTLYRELGPGLLRKLIKQASLSVERFNKL